MARMAAMENGSVRDDGATEMSPAKRRVMRVAAELFAEKGYGSVGISEVGDAAGLGKGALYYHIRSKEDLLYDIMTRYMVELIAGAERIMAEVGEPVARVEALSAALVDAVFDTRSEMTVCYREVHSLGDEKRSAVLHLHGDYSRVWARVLAEGAERGVFRPISRTELKALLGMYFYSFLWIRPDGRESSAEVSATFASLLLRAVRPDGSK